MSCEWVGVCEHCGHEVGPNHLCDPMCDAYAGLPPIESVTRVPLSRLGKPEMEGRAAVQALVDHVTRPKTAVERMREVLEKRRA